MALPVYPSLRAITFGSVTPLSYSFLMRSSLWFIVLSLYTTTNRWFVAHDAWCTPYKAIGCEYARCSFHNFMVLRLLLSFFDGVHNLHGYLWDDGVPRRFERGMSPSSRSHQSVGKPIIQSAKAGCNFRPVLVPFSPLTAFHSTK